MTLPTITQKQQSILTLLYRFRFLNRIQIQKLLRHKYHKRIIDWLNNLTEKEYIGKIYSTKYGEINKPAIYYISINGIRYLKALGYPAEQLNRLYKEKEKTESLVSKLILIADICLDLQNKNDNDIKYLSATNSDLADKNYKFNFLNEISPDLVFLKDSDGMKKYYLLEIFEPTLPQYSVRKKIKQYFDFYFSNTWEDNTQETFPTLLLVCPTTPALISTKRFARKLLSEYDEIDLKIKFTENNKMQEVGVVGEIWE